MILRLAGALVLLGCFAGAIVVADLVWNGSGLFYAIAGRDKLVQACQTPTIESLSGKGFSPTDLAFDRHPSIGFASGFGRSIQTLSAPFTFSDGLDGPRVDGAVVCTVSGPSVSVDVSVDSLPRRTT